jgi:hypothetical protein
LVTIFPIREYVEASGLMSYRLNFCEHYGCATYCVDGGLSGTHPSDLPVEVPKTFEFIINLTTAKSLGPDVPRTLLARRRGNRISGDFRCWRILLKKSFSGDDQNLLGPLMRFARGDVRDHIVSHKNNHGPS